VLVKERDERVLTLVNLNPGSNELLKPSCFHLQVAQNNFFCLFLNETDHDHPNFFKLHQNIKFAKSLQGLDSPSSSITV
jgi:hypothetical protein